MARRQWVLLILLVCLMAEGRNLDTPGRRKTKRQLDDVYLHSDVDLFHSGMMLALHYPQPLVYFGGDQRQTLDPGYLPQKSVHQHQYDIPSGLKNPTKPVYHFTPLPKGTFPAPKIDDGERQQNSEESNSDYGERQLNSDESSSDYIEDPSYLFGYGINDAEESLHMGRKEKMNGNFLQGVYHVLLPDNRMQIVHYWSDYTGYHPTITYA